MADGGRGTLLLGETWSLPAGARGATGAQRYEGTDWADPAQFRDFLPQPFRRIDQILDALIDDAFELARQRTKGERELQRLREEEAKIAVAEGVTMYDLPDQPPLVDAASLTCPLYDSLFLVATRLGGEDGRGRILVLDSCDTEEVVEVLQLEPGVETCCMHVVSPPPERATTLLALVLRAAAAADEPAKAAAGGADRLVVYQLATVSQLEESGSTWKPILLATVELGMRASSVQLSHDGRFAAVLGARTAVDGGASGGGGACCAVYALSKAYLAETLAQAAQAVDQAAGALDAPLVLDVPPPGPPPFVVAQRRLDAAAAAAAAADAAAADDSDAPAAADAEAEGGAVAAATCHFVLGQVARSVGEAVAYSCAGLYLWGAGSEEVHFYQLLPHSPPAEPRPPRPDRAVCIEPAAITASAINASTTLLALGYEDGSVALYNTTLHVPRFELAPHAGPVRFVALDRSAQLLSADGAGRVHVYALGADAAEHGGGGEGGGRLALRKPALASAAALGWGAPCACLPLYLLSPDDGGEALHVLDHAGARVGKVVAPAGRRFCTAGGGVGAHLCRILGDEQLVLLAADGAGGCALVLVDLLVAIGSFYPPLRARLGQTPALDILAQVFARYTHDQRGDESAMPIPLLLHDEDESAASKPTPSLAGRSKSGESVLRRTNSKTGSKLAASIAGSVAHDRATSADRPGLLRGGTRKPPSQGGAPSSAGSRPPTVARRPSFVDSAQGNPLSQLAKLPRSVAGSAAGGRSNADDARSAGSAKSGFAAKGRVGPQEYNDAAARVEQLLKARHYSRFAREARVRRRLEELALELAGSAPAGPAKRP